MLQKYTQRSLQGYSEIFQRCAKIPQRFTRNLPGLVRDPQGAQAPQASQVAQSAWAPPGFGQIPRLSQAYFSLTLQSNQRAIR